MKPPTMFMAQSIGMAMVSMVSIATSLSRYGTVVIHRKMFRTGFCLPPVAARLVNWLATPQSMQMAE